MYNILGKREYGMVKKKRKRKKLKFFLKWLEIKEDVVESWKLSQEWWLGIKMMVLLWHIQEFITDPIGSGIPKDLLKNNL